MPSTPHLRLVDPEADARAHRRSRLAAMALGVLIAGASAIPLALTAIR